MFKKKKSRKYKHIVLAAKTGNVNEIDGDKNEIIKAILSLEEDGLITVIYDEQSNPITFKKTKAGKLIDLDGGYLNFDKEQRRKKLLDNIAQFIANILSKFIGVVIVLAICKTLS